MRIAYLECFSGVSGDMFLGALVDAGVSPRLLEETVGALNIGARLEVSKVIRSGISATKVDVYVGNEKDLPREEYWAKQASGELSAKHDHHHSPTQHHHHASEPAAVSPDARENNSASHQHRDLSDIRKIIAAAPINQNARETAIRIFEALGTAEAKVHNVPVERIHFHEVGAADAIADIVCAAVGVDSLNVDGIVCSPLNVGGGTVICAHGTFPVPAPATLELLKDAPVFSSGLQAELVTPTGAAIVKTLAAQFASFPPMRIERSGYGAGSRDFNGVPNVVRLTIGETVSANATSDVITVLEANLDDLNPQIFGYVMDRLLEKGALDVFGMPVQMKKGRPGTLLTVLCKTEAADELTHLIFEETTTLGIRRREEARQTLARRWEAVQTSWGEVRIKIASKNGTITNYAPEYEDCRQIAAKHNVPLKTVMQEAARQYLGKETKR